MNPTNNKADELKLDELDKASGGAFHISWSAGSRCIDIGFGSTGIWFGAAGAGWYSGDKSGRL
ncbi:MAG: hypothetical protein J0H42_09110 [Rhizobiales bacterium]|nr:hypothetical protein [Hyphomicrobiales bacterium]